MKKVIFAILLFPIFVFAQETLKVGERTVSYDARSETEVGVLYYQGDVLVASEHEAVTLVYENEQLVLEAHDTDGDGTLDAFVTFDADEAVVEIAGEGATVFERPEVKELAELMVAEGEGGAGSADAPAEEDLVGSLDSIKIPGQGIPMMTIILWLAIIGGGYWYYRKRQEKAEE